MSITLISLRLKQHLLVYVHYLVQTAFPLQVRVTVRLLQNLLRHSLIQDLIVMPLGCLIHVGLERVALPLLLVSLNWVAAGLNVEIVQFLLTLNLLVQTLEKLKLLNALNRDVVNEIGGNRSSQDLVTADVTIQ